MKIAVIACPNGLGHIRRVIAITEFLYKNGFNGSVDLFAPNSQILHLNKIWSEARSLIGRKYFRSMWPADLNIMECGIAEIERRIFSEFDFSSYDVVWSDNLLGILEQRRDAKITGSFFWHEVLEANGYQDDNIQLWVNKSRSLLELAKPNIAAVQYFASPEIQKQINFFPVGLYRYLGLIGKKQSKSILLSCGLAGEEELNVRNAIAIIIANNKRPPNYLYVEPRLLPSVFPDWIRPADFTGDMFHEVLAACIRPGLGTISDSLISHSRIFSFSSSQSFEMKHNQVILEKMNLGESHHSALTAYQSALNFINNSNEIENQINRTLHLRTDGVMATAEFILR
jgi:hypothetical protein